MINELKNHIIDGLKQGMRSDNRGLLDYRPIKVIKNVSPNAEGSAKVIMGETEVICGVKLSLEKPYPDTPDQGSLMVNAEFVPMSSPEFESGPPGIDSIEVSRVIDRGIREAKAIDVKKLCIEKGEKIWMVMIDLVTINAAGNIFDSGALAALAAIENTRYPSYDGVELDYKKKSDKPLPIDKHPISVTVFKIGDFFLIDPNSEEEKVIDARLTVATLEDGSICAMQKGGESPLTLDDIKKMVDIGIEKGQELRKYLK